MADTSIQEKREKRRERRRKALQSTNKNSNKKPKANNSAEVANTLADPSGGDSGGGNPVVRSLVSVRDYFLGVRSELDKVIWPTREEATRLTWIVGGVTVASALFLGGLSILFTELFNVGVNQPAVFIGAFVAFLALLYAYARYISRSTPADY